ncbi:hypothetical protein E2562_006900 [Oryza meyeriana var. granulata]|uniref:Glyoxal oxidase N-terminal domain-containing protein n=1 Tax=Oryza meyeriana var. granulata TaxID=110450 RepID=A0A6G1BIU4_9ORYZ|nr:hypothetical protein E2562_006900 [Oryza meyeriana var. granulata]
MRGCHPSPPNAVVAHQDLSTPRVVYIFLADGQVLWCLPAIPGNMLRNYPSSGSSVLLLLRPESPTHAEVLVYGSEPHSSYRLTLRNGTFILADQTCGRIVPTEANPLSNVVAQQCLRP